MNVQFPILQPEIQEFIRANVTTAIAQLALLKNPFPSVNWSDILMQVEGRQKAKEKLPTWFSAFNVIYPTKVSIEQTSSEKSAAYKASIVAGDSIIDLTGGFGVDSFYFSKQFKSVVHCETDKDLSAIAQHNFKQLEADNIKCYCGDSEKLLQQLNVQFDWIFIDPSRRNTSKGKVFLLQDCIPNVPNLLDEYFMFTNHILLKTAPLLDISAGLNELQNVRKIHVIAVDNEVKELLWEISKNSKNQIEVSTVNISKGLEEKFSFTLNHQLEATYGPVKKYLYEPNRAIMKSGGFNAVSSQFGLDKLHPNSHLYTSDSLIEFPGRIFCVESILPYRKKEMKEQIQGIHANVTIRNFGESVDQIRKKWKISEGGETYCFFTTDLNDSKIVLLCSKIIEK